MVSTLNSHPADRGSIPLMNLKFFLFFLVILLRKYSLIIQKVQNSTQKLFVQFHYFKLFMYVYITYNEKKESKVLGHLLLITIIFWTVWKHFVFSPFLKLEKILTQTYSDNMYWVNVKKVEDLYIPTNSRSQKVRTLTAI